MSSEMHNYDIEIEYVDETEIEQNSVKLTHMLCLQYYKEVLAYPFSFDNKSIAKTIVTQTNDNSNLINVRTSVHRHTTFIPFDVQRK